MKPDTSIEEAGLLIEKLDDCFRSEVNNSFHNHVGLVKKMTSIVAEHLTTIATKSAEKEMVRIHKLLAKKAIGRKPSERLLIVDLMEALAPKQHTTEEVE